MVGYPVSLSNSVFSNVTFVLHTSCAGSTCTREISQQHTSGFLVFFFFLESWLLAFHQHTLIVFDPSDNQMR